MTRRIAPIIEVDHPPVLANDGKVYRALRAVFNGKPGAFWLEVWNGTNWSHEDVVNSPGLPTICASEAASAELLQARGIPLDPWPPGYLREYPDTFGNIFTVDGEHWPISVEYELGESGWATCTIKDLLHSMTMRLSYLSDPLRDLIEATVRILEGSENEEFTFVDEPGNYEWTLERSGDLLHVLVVCKIKGLRWRMAPRFEAETLVLRFATAVHGQAKGVLEHHGLDGYREAWIDAEFPLAAYEHLGELLRRAKHTSEP